jgi:primosomal protein N' (replication factor Y)
MNPDQYEILLPTVFDRAFDYLAPEGMVLNVGDIVSVPFGKQELLGVVWGADKAEIPAGKIKNIIKNHSEFPPLSDNFRKFIDWAAWYNCGAKGAMLKMVLPVDEIEKKGRVHLETKIDIAKINLHPLSEIQEKAADDLSKKLGAGFSVTLLDGVTGSGKTEVYFDAIARLLRAGTGEMENWGKEENNSPIPQFLNSTPPQILILLPEIGLSIQWLERFEARFGFAPVVWHSGVTPAKKRASWQAISRGEARVVVGARSALFLPYKNLSLVVVDEEHDASFKQEEGVMYHARDMAVARARFKKFPVLLVSATPSLESYHNARQGKYSEISLPLRHADAVMPEINLVDMRREKLNAQEFVSSILREKLANAVAAGHQAMLFLNRRGYAPLMLCRACGHRFQCPDCSAWLVTHRSKPRLECHHCGYNIPIPKTCPSCAAEDTLHACGPGVERILEEVKGFLPEARVAVMASDSMGGQADMAETIQAMTEKRMDILIGTQMIAKGHHFADLAVVGVVDADLGLAGGDLRASERTYQLLHQLSGRAGREAVRGSVYLQSFLPDHPVIKALISGDREAFLSAEITARENANMPPFSRLAAIIVEGEKEEDVIKTANQLASSLKPQAPSLHLYGPAPAPLFMLRAKFRYRLLVKAQRNINLPDLMKKWVDGVKTPSNTRIKIDIDPQSFM